MSFLQPWVLWGLLGMAIPVIIHLLNRRRYRTVKWAAMDFLLKATRESRGRKKLRYFLILLSRVLIVGMLATAVARPLVGGFLGWGGASVDTVIVVLDRSASMERVDAEGGESKRLRALRQVVATLRGMEGTRVYLLESVGGKVLEMPSPATLLETGAIQGTDAGADLPDLLLRAGEFLNDSGHGESEVWVASDLQRSNWKPEDVRWNAVRELFTEGKAGRRLRVLGFGTTGGENRSVTVSLARREGRKLLLELEVSRDSGGGKDAFPTTFSLMGLERSEQLAMEAGRLVLRRNFDLSEDGSEWGWGWVGLPPDANMRDNRSYFVYGAEEEVWSYLVGDKTLNEEVEQSLLRALAPPGYRMLRSQAIEPQDWGEVHSAKAAALVWAAELPETGSAEEANLLDYAQAGGRIIFLPGGKGEATNSFAGVAWGKPETSPDEEFFTVKKWRQDEGLLRDGLDGTPLPMGRLQAIKRALPLGETLGELAQWDDGEPFVRRLLLGKGACYFVGCLPDYEWSNLEHTGLHLVMLQRAVELGETRLSGGAGRYVGQVSEGAEGKWERVDKTLGSGKPSEGPGSQAGIYRSGEGLAAFNRPPMEDDALYLDKREIGTLFGEISFGFFEDANDEKGSLVREAWRVFLLLALLFLLVEAILCLQPKMRERATGRLTPTGTRTLQGGAAN